jgi:hypothetical protein
MGAGAAKIGAASAERTKIEKCILMLLKGGGGVEK